MRSAIEQAAGEVRAAMTTTDRVQGPEWALIVDLVREVMRALMARCAPTPQAGYAYLTRGFTPLELLFGAERRRQRRIRHAVAAGWRGPAEQLPEVQSAVRTAIDRRLTRTLMNHLYRECDPAAAREVRT